MKMSKQATPSKKNNLLTFVTHTGMVFDNECYICSHIVKTLFFSHPHNVSLPNISLTAPLSILCPPYPLSHVPPPPPHPSVPADLSPEERSELEEIRRRKGALLQEIQRLREELREAIIEVEGLEASTEGRSDIHTAVSLPT